MSRLLPIPGRECNSPAGTLSHAGRVTLNIPRGVLELKVPGNEQIPDTDTPICVCCGSGGRAALAAARLQELGYTNVVSLEGGFKGWCDAGQPVATAATGSDEEE